LAEKSASFEKIISVLARVPKGRVATYGQVAKIAGFPGHARQVVWALHSSSRKRKLPWHRVINSRGYLGLDGHGRTRQKALLLREGVEVDAYGRVDLERFGWKKGRRN
jgi:methylated-DNA-protein-cysteine methyltransferase-like protein